MPKIPALFTFHDIWQVGGPFIITGGVIIVIGIIAAIFLATMKKGFLKDVVSLILIVVIVAVAYLSFLITSNIWGS